MNIVQKIMFIIIDFPFSILRDITIPACELKNWNQTIFNFMPLTAVIFIFLVTGRIKMLFMNLTIGLITLVIIVVLIIVLNLTTYRNRLPSYLMVM